MESARVTPCMDAADTPFVGIEYESQIRDHRQLATQLLDHADALRREVAPRLALKRKSELGQFMTPAAVARFMASLFPPSTLKTCRLLDAGAGVGALTCAFLDRWSATNGLHFQNVEVEAHEIDAPLRAHFETTLATYAARLPVTCTVLSGDFILEAACRRMQTSRRFTHAILNPPYKKINSAIGTPAHLASCRHRNR